MPHFIEKVDGSFEFVNADVNEENLGEEVVAAYVVSEKLSRTSTFKRETVAPKQERRFRCQDGTLKLKSEMTDEDIAFLNEKMAKARSARKKAA